MIDRETLGQLLRYGIVGLSLNGAGYVLYLLLTVVAGINPLVVVGVMYPVTVLAGYIFNRRWSFRHSGEARRSGPRYFLAYAGGYLLNLGLLELFWARLGFPHPLVQAAAIFIVAAYLFLALRFWVFPAKPDSETSAAQGGT